MGLKPNRDSDSLINSGVLYPPRQATLFFYSSAAEVRIRFLQTDMGTAVLQSVHFLSKSTAVPLPFLTTEEKSGRRLVSESQTLQARFLNTCHLHGPVIPRWTMVPPSRWG